MKVSNNRKRSLFTNDDYNLLTNQNTKQLVELLAFWQIIRIREWTEQSWISTKINFLWKHRRMLWQLTVLPDGKFRAKHEKIVAFLHKWPRTLSLYFKSEWPPIEVTVSANLFRISPPNWHFRHQSKKWS